jgi:pyruvate formate lyase activating enzyme
MKCDLCFHHCDLSEGQTGLCRARSCRDGRIVSDSYGLIAGLALDPIEKKPLRRFHPGSLILSVGTFGCNLNCPFCQNYSLSAHGRADYPDQLLQVTPQMLAEQAQSLVPRGNIGLAYTYNEPLVSYEFVRSCAQEIRSRHLLNVLVSNGTLEEPYFRALLPLIDAANIDLKGFTPAWYRRLGGSLDNVKRNIALAAENCHLEVTTLIVPDCNDREEDMRRECAFLQSIDRTIPLHITRFFPRYQMADAQPTPVKTVLRLTEIAREYLDFVYPGNL